MGNDQKELIQLRCKLSFYKKLSDKIGRILDGEMTIDEYDDEVYNKIYKTETKLENHKFKMNLPDELWDEDED